MYTPVYTKQFGKDTKRCVRRGKNMDKFKILVPALLSGKPLDKHRDHALVGHWQPSRDCHVEPDWILIYTADEETLRLERTGTSLSTYG